jgi:class 3 adenylate cyclase
LLQQGVTYDSKKKRKEKGKIGHLDKTTQSVLKRMISEDDDNSSGNVKQKELLIDLETQSKQRKDRFWSALKERYQYDTSIKRGQDYLLNYVSSKIPLIIMYADLVGSTKMSMTLPVDKLVTIIRAFSPELSSVVKNYDGYVLKYVGDAVIAFFAPGLNICLTYDKAIRSAKSMIDVMTHGINPVLNKYDYPDLYVKIGIDSGENVVVQYAYDKSSQIDLLGYTMNIAAKQTILHSRAQIKFQ